MFYTGDVSGPTFTVHPTRIRKTRAYALLSLLTQTYEKKHPHWVPFTVKPKKSSGQEETPRRV